MHIKITVKHQQLSHDVEWSIHMHIGKYARHWTQKSLLIIFIHVQAIDCVLKFLFLDENRVVRDIS